MKKLPQKRWMSLWRHFFDREKTPEQLTSVMIEWQEKWQWDLVKINPPACYHVLDWGADYEFYEDGGTEPKLRKPVLEKAEDVFRIGLLDVHSGVLGGQLQVIRELRRHFGPSLPIVETVFSPLEIAHRLMLDRDALVRLRSESSESLHLLLQNIMETFRNFSFACLQAGADGIFFATKWATSDLLSWRDYDEFGRRYELPILQTLQQMEALVILHVCGERTYLKNMLNYPVDIFSYDFFAEKALSPQEVIAETEKYVLGGIHPLRLQEDVRGVVQDCQPFLSLPGWLAGPSCVIPPNVSDQTIRMLKSELCSLS